MLKNKIPKPFFISFALILFIIFIVYPIIYSIVLSFQSCEGVVCEFTGLGNIERMFRDEIFHSAVTNTLLFLVIQVPIMIFMAIFLASLLNIKNLKFKTFYRTAIFLPCVTSLVAYSVLFKLMFGLEGIVNNLLLSIGVLEQPFMWLGNPITAKIVIIIALLWRWTGYNMIFFLAAMQNIPAEIYDAALIDGASRRQTFFKVTLPNLRPIILLTTIMSTIGTLQLFDEPKILTEGGPGTETLTISQYIYNTSFVTLPDFGYAVTMSYFIVAIVVGLSLIQNRYLGEKNEAKYS